MNDLITSQIRTYVPLVAGVFLTWLTSLGFEFDAENETLLVSALTAALSALYYFVVRKLEARWPKAGVLLGVGKAPQYK